MPRQHNTSLRCCYWLLSCWISISASFAFNSKHLEFASRPGCQSTGRRPEHRRAQSVASPFAFRKDPSLMAQMPSVDQMTPEGTSEKRIVFIRHGRTYMNDYLNGFEYGGPGFTDVFPDEPEYKSKFYDSPLGPTGMRQAKELNTRLKDVTAMSLPTEHQDFLSKLDLVVVSPLTRALETMEIGLLSHIKTKGIPIVALPAAAERLYLVSDLGKTPSQLKQSFEYVDFTTGFEEQESVVDGDDEYWHFIPTEKELLEYEEWRPNGAGQRYACPGEPQRQFDERMIRLYRWLGCRNEKTIVLVCHWGVIDWMIQESFDNCELRVVPFDSLKPRSLTLDRSAA